MLNSIPHNVLFTGGLDSTYRLCQLARDEKAIVQPVYILFPDNGKSSHVRPELQREVESQNKILSYIQNHPSTKANILPIKRVLRDEIPKSQGDASLIASITQSKKGNYFNWELQLARSGLGWQYYYIALYSHWFPNVELCQERFPISFSRNKIKFYCDENGRNKILLDESPKKVRDFFEFLFGRLNYPIIGVTRQQMKNDLEKWGYDGIWEYIWFCYESKDGKPCGICDNCFIKLDEGLFFLFNNEAIHRYFIYRIIKKFFSVENFELVIFCQQYMIYGEKRFFNYVTDERLYNNYGLSKLLSIHMKFLKKLYCLNDKKLKKIFLKCRTKDEVYREVMR